MSGIDFAFPVTFFTNFAAQTKREQHCTVHDLADLARETTASTKDNLPWWKLASFGDKRSERNSFRNDGNVRFITGIEADYDAEKIAFDDAAELLDKLGLLSVLYTSPSHTEDTPRWRVIAPTSIGMQPDKRRHMLGRLNGAFRGVFSIESWTLSQSYYYGSVRGNPSHRVEVFLGHTIDQLDDLDESWIGQAASAKHSTDTTSRDAREDAELISRAITGDGYHTELRAIASRYIGRGIPEQTVTGILQGIMLSHPAQSRDGRWKARWAEIPKLVASAANKYEPQAAARKAVARECYRLVRRGATDAEIQAGLLAVANENNVAHEVVDRIAAHIFAEASHA